MSPSRNVSISHCSTLVRRHGRLVDRLGAANAADKVTFLTSWYAQAEHGGFYQAKATGLYDKENLDVTIKMGGPQVNGMQLLLGGEADVIIGYDFQVLNGVSKGLPVTTIATSFQKDLQGMMTHADVKDLGDLKGKTILVATSGRTRAGGRGSRRNLATPRRRRRLIPLTCNRSSPTITSPSNHIRRRSLPGHAEEHAGKLLPVR